MPSDINSHRCKNVPCKCEAADNADYCDDFCAMVETSEDDQKCGCGHMACDLTSQIGNELTFDATGS